MYKKLLVLGCISTMMFADNPTFGKTFYRNRPQGINLARQMAGQAHHWYLCDEECINGSLAMTFEYGRTFNTKDLAQFLFFNGTDTMKFGPAGAVETDVFARNFFLNDQFEGTVSARPQIQNAIFDINFYLGLDEWTQGLWFRIDIPINWTSWDMRLTESITSRGATIAANRLGNMAAEASPLSSIIEAWKGERTGGSTFPYLKEVMKFATINERQTEVGVADITMQLGYNFICNECAHFGIMFDFIIPTGTRPDAHYVFEPIVGNGRHVCVGGGFTGHFEFWNNGCDQSFGLYMEGDIYHMFRSKQKRTFDLTQNGIGSRYLLFKRFDPATNLFANEILYGPNVTTLECNVKNDAQGEIAAMFDYRNAGFTFDIGYNLWGITRDKIHITGEIPLNTYGVQGDTVTNAGGLTTDLTQELTDIKGNFLPDPAVNLVTITTSDLDVSSAEHPAACSHKVFTHIAYTWENCDYLPFIGIGGEVEFTGKKNNALSQWGAWVKGGFTFS